jgi:hypothetical protein
MEKTTPRRSPRIARRIPVLLVWKGEDQQEHREKTFTFSVSWFGCAVRSYKFFRPGTQVQLHHESAVMEARVVYSLWDHQTNLVEVGLAWEQDGREFWGISVWI